MDGAIRYRQYHSSRPPWMTLKFKGSRSVEIITYSIIITNGAKEVKYLGYTMQKHKSWELHIRELASKLQGIKGNDHLDH